MTNYKFQMDAKHLKFLVPTLVVVIILFGFFKRDNNQFAFKNQNREIELSQETQNELWGFYNKAHDLSGRSNRAIQKSDATFLAVGDIMLSRNVAQKIKDTNDPLLPFRTLDDLFESVDFSFANLESPFSDSDNFNPTGSMIFNAPRDNIKGLVENKFKILNLANNHALDQGLDGLEYTINYLNENSIKHTGAGMTLDDAWAPVVIEQNGIKLCFIGASYASINDNGKTTNNYVARIQDLDRLKSSISYLASTCDFVVASMHAGTEYTTKPNQAQIDFAHAAIDAGANMVIGHHPHWVQEIELYCPHPLPTSPLKGEETALIPLPRGEGLGEGDSESQCANPKYIFYSLGNFIFDQMWSQKTREGLALKIQISNFKFQNNLQGPRTPATLDSIELIPIIIDNYSTPRLADEKESKEILEKIKIPSRFLPLEGGG
ncbi:MAG: CapA family protein [Patescibacteria group bacterium]